MSAKYFLDTNIFVYSFDERSPEKQARALELIAEGLQSGEGVISTQVMQEFLNVATRKFQRPLKAADASLYLQKVLYPLCHVFPDLALYQSAIDLQHEGGFSFYDALILAGALRAGCGRLYSEDLQNGQRLGQLEIVNPFVPYSYTR